MGVKMAKTWMVMRVIFLTDIALATMDILLKFFFCVVLRVPRMA